MNDDCIRDSLDLAVDINNEWIFDAYGENELTFEFIEDMLKNTNGDFMFLDDYEIVFERRNGLLIAVDSNDHFHTCSFKNCYELLKSKHINGKHDDYDFEIRQNYINSLSDADYNKLIEKLETNPELQNILGLALEEGERYDEN